MEESEDNLDIQSETQEQEEESKEEESVSSEEEESKEEQEEVEEEEVEQEEEEEKKKKTKKEKKKREIARPKDSKSFFRARAKVKKDSGLVFNFTASGDIQVPEMRGQAAGVIELPFYRPATIDEIREAEEERLDAIAVIEKEYDETSKLLKIALEEWRATGVASTVLDIQKKMSVLDSQRAQIISPIRWTKIFKRVPNNKIDFSNMYEDRTIPYPLEVLKRRSLALNKTVIEGTKEEFEELRNKRRGVEKEVEEEETPIEDKEESFVLFFDPADEKHGLLSPDTKLDVIFHSTKYTSLTQAFEVERVTAVGRKDFRPILLRQTNPRSLKQLSSKVKGVLEDPKQLWIDILKAYVAQHPEVADILRETEKDTLVYADPRDTEWGIGLPVEDPGAIDRTAWQGKNILGQAWQAVREGLQKQTGGYLEEEGVGEYTEQGKTEKERQAEEKRRYFIGLATRKKRMNGV